MHAIRMTGAVLAAILLLAGCGASAGSTGAAATQGAAATEGAEATDEGAAGTGTPDQGGDTNRGTAHFDLTGAKTASGDLGFLVQGSLFELNGNKSAILNFLGSDGATGLVLTLSPDLTNVVLAAPGIGASELPWNGVMGTCTVTTSELDDHAAKGSFQCEHIAIAAGGELVGEGTLRGTFDAHS